MPANPDRLKPYRAKRSAARTPEPFGSAAAEGGRIFVVQKHAARRLHYDFRLEWNGVLLSWAVPNGPSRNPADKQLAVHVEDHPVEYAEFEGIIPKDNYGAGAVILWGRGSFTFLKDPDAGMEKGKLLFELRGQKLKGRWTLVKIKKAEKEWLLIKERDGFASENGQDFPQDSVLSGLTIEELSAGKSPAHDIERELRAAKAVERRVTIDEIKFMLAETRDQAFSRAGWLFELKYDGYRLLLAKENDLRSLPLRDRKEILRRVLPKAGFLRYTDHVETRGEDFYRAAQQMDLEGMVAKNASSKYRGGRSNECLKVRFDQTDDYVIVGYTAPRGSRTASRCTSASTNWKVMIRPIEMNVFG